MDIKEKFEEFIAQYPIFEYRLLNAADVSVHERVRTICREECERYGSTGLSTGSGRAAGM